MSRLEAMTAESAAKSSTTSKRKNAPKEDEDDGSGSDGDSDVVSHHLVLLFRVEHTREELVSDELMVEYGQCRL